MSKKSEDPAEVAKREEKKREKNREKLRQELLAGVKEGPDQEEVKKEEVISAVAEEMLRIFSTWPEEIQALVGIEQPNKESFVHGIAYVIRAYLHKARGVLRMTTLRDIKEAETLAARAMGPLHDVKQRLTATQKRVMDNEVESLKATRDREIRESEKAIRSKYNVLITQAMGRSSEELNSVMHQMVEVENTFLLAKTTLVENEQLLKSVMADLEAPYAEVVKPAVKISSEGALALAVAAAVDAG